ncbi:malonyl-CoA decarboxylase, mitochondrial-like isoform X1 [Portunus trituberculatus]|uniref:malonyl-CoA decarboxylase, mitochondrial-like isoform X1 n=2 Tax=Portunus trituberculatus TaxID=210409 RepID=UPI001E1CD10C|nr:malonyl-CoA decarboxylase, mitochondrial-like isoform X1 [Portunus trituberculatus]
MYRCKYKTQKALLPLVQLIECGARDLQSSSRAGMTSTPPGTPGHRPGSNRKVTSPIPIVRSAGALSPLSLGSFSFSSSRPLTPSPMPSPPSSPPAPSSPSGLIQAAKDALMDAVSKKDSKTSYLAIDEDMRDMCYYYTQLGTDERSEFLMYMATALSTDHHVVEELIQQKPKVGDNDSGNGAQLLRWEDRLRHSLQPPHHWVFSQISRLSGGVKFLVDMRQDLLATLYTKASDPTASVVLKTLDTVLRELLSLWFTVGLLDVQRITWESPCNLLQKISEYEAVHPVRNWTDLKRRVGLYRRCFTFTHSCMPKEPLVVLHIFLTNEISNSMAKILQSSRASSTEKDSMKKDHEDPAFINTAIFYSITSTQKGLQGIELGNYLIKRVVHELKAEFPNMTQFSSLSPIPGYVKWLNGMMAQAQRGEVTIFTKAEEVELMKCLEVKTPSAIYDCLKKLFTTSGWVEETELVNALDAPLMRLCAYYLAVEKRRGYALDSVANFHLKNGAVLWRINWQADQSHRGLANSCGIMVNYRYFLDECETNSRTYLESQEIILSESVKFLVNTALSKVVKKGSESSSVPLSHPQSPTPPLITVTPDSKI